LGIRFKNKQFKYLLVEFHDKFSISNKFKKIIDVFTLINYLSLFIGIILISISSFFLGCFTSNIDNDLDCLSNQEIAILFSKILLSFLIFNIIISITIYLNGFVRKK
jgi:hypothetical protein